MSTPSNGDVPMGLEKQNLVINRPRSNTTGLLVLVGLVGLLIGAGMGTGITFGMMHSENEQLRDDNAQLQEDVDATLQEEIDDPEFVPSLSAGHVVGVHEIPLLQTSNSPARIQSEASASYLSACRRGRRRVQPGAFDFTAQRYDAPGMCCMGLTLDCIACGQGLPVGEFCAIFDRTARDRLGLPADQDDCEVAATREGEPVLGWAKLTHVGSRAVSASTTTDFRETIEVIDDADTIKRLNDMMPDDVRSAGRARGEEGEAAYRINRGPACFRANTPNFFCRDDNFCRNGCPTACGCPTARGARARGCRWPRGNNVRTNCLTWTGSNHRQLSAVEEVAPAKEAVAAPAANEVAPTNPERRQMILVGPDSEPKVMEDFRHRVDCDRARDRFPYTAIVAVGRGCSGVLIGGDWVLTAAHCMGGFRGFGRNRRFTWNVPTSVHPQACNDESGPSEYVPEEWWVHANYRTARDTFAYDMGLIKLKRSTRSGRSIGDTYGTMSLRATETMPDNFGANIYGFPGSAGSPATNRNTGAERFTFELWGHEGQLFNAGSNFDVRGRPTQLTTRTIDVTGGQSGGPCFAVINGVHTVVGTVRGSFDGATARWNDCVAYTSDKIGDIIAATDGQVLGA